MTMATRFLEPGLEQRENAVRKMQIARRNELEDRKPKTLEEKTVIRSMLNFLNSRIAP